MSSASHHSTSTIDKMNVIIGITINFVSLCYLLLPTPVLIPLLSIGRTFIIVADRKTDVLLHSARIRCPRHLVSCVGEWATVYTRLGLIGCTPIAQLVWWQQNRYLYQLGRIHCPILLFGMVSHCLFEEEEENDTCFMLLKMSIKKSIEFSFWT